MDRSGLLRPGLALLGAALALGATLLVAAQSAFRYGGLLSPLGLWIAGAAGVGLLVAGAALPSARSGTSAVRRSLSVTGLVAAAAVVASGVVAMAALPAAVPSSGGPTPAPGEMEGAPAFVLVDLRGAVTFGAKTEGASCSTSPTGAGSAHYQAKMPGPGDLPLNVEFDVEEDGRISFLLIGAQTPGDEFQFASGKYWEAGPPWIVPVGAPTQRNGSATLTGLVDVVQPPDANPGAPPREVSGTLTWECLG